MSRHKRRDGQRMRCEAVQCTLQGAAASAASDEVWKTVASYTSPVLTALGFAQAAGARLPGVAVGAAADQRQGRGAHRDGGSGSPDPRDPAGGICRAEAGRDSQRQVCRSICAVSRSRYRALAMHTTFRLLCNTKRCGCIPQHTCQVLLITVYRPFTPIVNVWCCRARAARQDAARLNRVLETLTPPAGAAELEILPGGLKDFINDGERRLLFEAYCSLPGADHTAWACATALGL